jgi:hypothetical protein
MVVVAKGSRLSEGETVTLSLVPEVWMTEAAKHTLTLAVYDNCTSGTVHDIINSVSIDVIGIH